MPSLEAYRPSLEYSYAPGYFPATECVLRAPDLCRRMLFSARAEGTEAAENLKALCRERNIRTETADRALSRVSGKENCFAAAVFTKREAAPAAGQPQVLLVNSSDCGNLGTILRTALGFGVEDVALIRPCADVFDPRTVRASMGALFQLRIKTYPDYEAWLAENPGRPLYPFMLQASMPMEQALAAPLPPNWTLVFGNEGSGLPEAYARRGQPVRIPSNDRVDSLNLSVAAAIGIYAFVSRSANLNCSRVDPKTLQPLSFTPSPGLLPL